MNCERGEMWKGFQSIISIAHFGDFYVDKKIKIDCAVYMYSVVRRLYIFIY